jgi:hypothetical protein
MTLNFNKTLQQSLEKINYLEHYEFIVNEGVIDDYEQLINNYGAKKWAIVDLLNEKFKLNSDLINWLHWNENDEVAYFLSETGSNALHHSEFKIPHKFTLWIGEKGFIIGVAQKGKGFNALEVHDNRIMDNKGAAFNFFRKCKGSIFFDDSSEAKIVYFEHIL